MKIRERCIWCKSEDTYLLGASGFITYHHCMSCSADFQADRSEFAWTKKEVDEHDKLYKQKT